jgi:predicted transporter
MHYRSLLNLSQRFLFRWVSPSKANVFRSFEVILNFVLQLHFEHTLFYPENAVGIFFLMAAVVIMAYEKEAIAYFAHCRFL